MPQVVEFPPLTSTALVALIRVAKEIPAKGEPFREFRSRLRGAKLWDKDRPLVLLRFLGVGSAINNSYYGGGSAHVEWCREHYRTYNPQTNTYFAGGGVARTCNSPYEG